jgi:RNA polymerase subunit RPABC4/transcription elongation factor Spt4
MAPGRQNGNAGIWVLNSDGSKKVALNSQSNQGGLPSNDVYDIKEDKSKPFSKPESSNVLMVEESSNIAPEWFKNCLNKDCMYNLPKDAKFCLKCGTAQLPKFCSECGFSFPGMEKFCPDCGKKR